LKEDHEILEKDIKNKLSKILEGLQKMLENYSGKD
jgi:hypothetical protein